MRKILFTVLMVFGFVAYGFAQGGAQSYINKHMKTDPNFRNAVIAICAVDEKGNVIAQWNPEMPLLTASTMKTISTGAGLHALGKDFKYKTQVAYTGEIKNGVLHGDVVIIGGGDPTLGSSDTLAYSIDSIFGVWAQGLKAAGIQRVEGNVVVDDSYFVREQMPDSWSWGKFGA